MSSIGDEPRGGRIRYLAYGKEGAPSPNGRARLGGRSGRLVADQQSALVLRVEAGRISQRERGELTLVLVVPIVATVYHSQS